jgi:hypothetical protein
MSKDEASNFLDWQINKYEKFDVVFDTVRFAIELICESLKWTMYKSLRLRYSDHGRSMDAGLSAGKASGNIRWRRN